MAHKPVKIHDHQGLILNSREDYIKTAHNEYLLDKNHKDFVFSTFQTDRERLVNNFKKYKYNSIKIHLLTFITSE